MLNAYLRKGTRSKAGLFMKLLLLRYIRVHSIVNRRVFAVYCRPIGAVIYHDEIK